jgi:hypothetical protein
MPKSWITATIFGLALITSPTTAQSCKTSPADEAAVVQALRTFYVAATVDDTAKMHTVTAPSLYIFDDGNQYSSIDDLMNVVKEYQQKGVKFVWNVTKPHVTAHCNDAWITYLNDGSIQMPGAPASTPTQWLESAILEKKDGTWKIVFFHSTRVPPPAVPAK